MKTRKANSTQRPFTLNSFLTKLDKDLIAAANYAQDAAEQIEGGYQKQLHKLLGAGFGMATALKDPKNKKTLQELIKDPTFTDGNQNQPRLGNDVTRLLTVVYRYIFKAGADAHQLRDCCLKYSTALAPYLKKGVIDPKDI